MSHTSVEPNVDQPAQVHHPGYAESIPFVLPYDLSSQTQGQEQVDFATQQSLLALQSYIAGIPKFDEGRHHRRRFGEAGGRYRGREWDPYGLCDVNLPPLPPLGPMMPQPLVPQSLGDAAKQEQFSPPDLNALLGLRPEQLQGSFPSQEFFPPDLSALLGLRPEQLQAQGSHPAQEQSFPPDLSALPGLRPEQLQAQGSFPPQDAGSSSALPPLPPTSLAPFGFPAPLPPLPSGCGPAEGAQPVPPDPQLAMTVSSLPFSSQASLMPPPPLMNALVPYPPLAPWETDTPDAGFIQQLMDQPQPAEVTAGALSVYGQIPLEESPLYNFVRSARISPEEGYNLKIMEPYNPSMDFLTLLAKEIQACEKVAQGVKVSQRRKGNLRYMGKPDFRPDYPGLLDNCSIYALDLRDRRLIADFKRCGDNEIQYSFGKPMTKKINQLMEFNGLRYTEYYSTCQGVLACPQAAERPPGQTPCVLLRPTSSRCRTCPAHDCALRHLKCDVRLVKYVLEPNQPDGGTCTDHRERHLLVCVGQHLHPLPPPTNLPFKLVWAIEAYIQTHDRINLNEMWCKIRHLHPTLASKDTVRDIIRQVRAARQAKKKLSYQGSFDPFAFGPPPLLGMPFPFFQQPGFGFPFGPMPPFPPAFGLDEAAGQVGQLEGVPGELMPGLQGFPAFSQPTTAGGYPSMFGWLPFIPDAAGSGFPPPLNLPGDPFGLGVSAATTPQGPSPWNPVADAANSQNTNQLGQAVGLDAITTASIPADWLAMLPSLTHTSDPPHIDPALPTPPIPQVPKEENCHVDISDEPSLKRQRADAYPSESGDEQTQQSAQKADPMCT